MRNKRSCILLFLLFLLCLSACTKNKEEDTAVLYDLSGKTFYNTQDRYGHEDHSSLWLGKDGSFVLSDSYKDGYEEYTGQWTLNENVLTLKTGDSQTILLEATDSDTLILRTALKGSKTEDSFSTTEVKGSTAPAEEQNKEENTITPEPAPEPEKKTIPCTKITSLYHNYWSYENTKDWDLEIRPVPADTTDTMTFKSNDTSVVTIDENGKATAVAPGKTTIDVTCGDQKLTVGYEVRKKGVSQIVLKNDKIKIPLGGREPIEFSLLPETAADKSVTYSSSDPSVFVFDEKDRIFPKTPGVAKATITAASGVSASVDVCVEGSMLMTDMKDGQSLKGGSGDIIYFQVYKLKCEDWKSETQDLRLAAEINVSDPSLLSFDNKGRFIADKNSVSSTKDVQVWFYFEDEDFPGGASTPKYTIHITP